MTYSGKCDSCMGGSLGDLVIPPTHCHGRVDRPAPKGVLGGFRCGCPCRFQPHELHQQAHARYPNDKVRAVLLYNELMREAGHIVERLPEGKNQK